MVPAPLSTRHLWKELDSHTLVGGHALGTGSYAIGIALDGVGSCLVDNLRGDLRSGIGVLDVVTCRNETG